MSSDDTSYRPSDELYIVSGVHGGTRVPLSPAENELLSLGQDDDNEIALADDGIEPFHVQIRHEDGAWQLLLLGPGSNELGQILETEVWLPMPKAFQIADVWLSVAPAGSTMPDPLAWQATHATTQRERAETERQAQRRAALEEAREAGAEDGFEDSTEGSGTSRFHDEDARDTSPRWRERTDDDDDDDDDDDEPPSKLAHHRRTSVLALVALGVCALLPRALSPGHLALLHTYGFGGTATSATAHAPRVASTANAVTAKGAQSPHAASAASEAAARPINPQLAAILAQPHWSSLHVSRRADGVELVSGSLPDRASYDALAAQLARVVPRPALNVLTGDDVRDIVRSTLDDYAPTLNLDIDNKRHIKLSGAAISAQQVDLVLGRLRHALPDYYVTTGQIDYPADIVRRTRADLAAAGLRQAEVQWDGQRIVVSGDFSAEQENSLDGALHVLDERYRSRIPFTAHIAHAGADAATASDNSLPFTIRSVIGGTNPYLMISDGTIVSPGGSYRGWHLKAIEADRILFDSPRLLMVQR
ncbi:hypothetical protein [Paraburkholderia bonniea]|uniref:hypothetical protein n=1 Tax=Paraburkholderia bonniea TaxID=2152891 RepID=UPI0012926703|nr:hypothetical protein [Paraburkholderia bonniea]